MPANVTVTAGATTATFMVTTATVTAATVSTITAGYNGVTRTATVTVNPASAGATLTVSATGRSGERVTSSPTGINVSGGQDRLGELCCQHLDHVERDERARRHLVGRLLERRQQDQDLHVHDYRHRLCHRECAVGRRVNQGVAVPLTGERHLSWWKRESMLAGEQHGPLRRL